LRATGLVVLVSFALAWGMLRTWIEDVIGRLKQLGSHADGLEDENRRLQAELAGLLKARRDNEDTFTIRQWDRSGTTLVDAIASAQNLYVARAALREYVRQYPARRMTLQIAAHVIDEHVPREAEVKSEGLSPDKQADR
jgi:flagellar hook-associated protein FlgK